MTEILFKTGNRTVVSLPNEMLVNLGLADGSEVSIELDRETRVIMIQPLKSALTGVDEVFTGQVAEFIAEYRPALEALAR